MFLLQVGKWAMPVLEQSDTERRLGLLPAEETSEERCSRVFLFRPLLSQQRRHLTSGYFCLLIVVSLVTHNYHMSTSYR